VGLGRHEGGVPVPLAKDITTYRYTLEDTAALARRDVLMELDCSEMGDVTVKEPGRWSLNIKDSLVARFITPGAGHGQAEAEEHGEA
jgi:hypothetical protein